MLIDIFSDLHLEFRQGNEKEFWNAFPQPKSKLCICAGDLTSFGLPDTIVYKHFTGLCNRYEKVLFVSGNHEYYGTDPETVERKLAFLEDYLSPNFVVLRAGMTHTFDGQRFIGGTLWFPDRPEVHIYRRLINDSFQIKGLFPWCFTQSGLLLSWLKSSVRPDDIVVTHHVPTEYDVDPIWKTTNTQAYFTNMDCERYLQNPNFVKPKAWVYGHTHDKHDFTMGGIRFICNPVGYPGERGQIPQSIEPCVYEL